MANSAGWRQIGDQKIYARSIWESNIGRWLEYQRKQGWILAWKHEPKTFWFEGIKRGCVSYKPDYQVFIDEDSWYWIEVKGFYDAKSKTKIKRFKKYFPNEELRVLDKEFFKKNNAKLRLLISGWESGNVLSASRYCKYRRSN